jgi:hypothetical protein
VGQPAGKDVADRNWTGRELVGFRLHLPSRIEYHNAGAANQRRGNILVWEQPLVDRLRGRPLTLDARMQTQSILYRTLGLFGATFVAVALMFGLIIWFVLRRGARAEMVAQRIRSAGAAGDADRHDSKLPVRLLKGRESDHTS